MGTQIVGTAHGHPRNDQADQQGGEGDHTERALKILTGDDQHDDWPEEGLPKWIAVQKRWRPDFEVDAFLEGRSRGEPTLETFQKWHRRHATCELCLVELAAWVVACCPMTYRVIPPHMQRGYLADYDRREDLHLHVVIQDASSYVIKESEENGIPADIAVNLIDQILEIHLRMAQDRIKQGLPK
jgi:hypothetical protein